MYPSGMGWHSWGLGSHQAVVTRSGEESRKQLLGLGMARPGWRRGGAVAHHVSVHVFESMQVSLSAQEHIVKCDGGRARICACACAY